MKKIIVLVIVAGVAGAFYYWWNHRGLPDNWNAMTPAQKDQYRRAQSEADRQRATTDFSKFE